MLTLIRQEELDCMLDRAWALAQDPACSGYPRYTDGTKTRADFEAALRGSFRLENEEVLLYAREGRARGLIHAVALPQDRYLSPCAFLTEPGEQAAALAEFEEYAARRWPGTALWQGFPAENANAVGWLQANGYALVEECEHYTALLAGYAPRPRPAGAAPLRREQYEAFRALHDRQQGMYWNSDRIGAALDRWRIWCFWERGALLGAAYAMGDGGLAEIFGVDLAEGVSGAPQGEAVTHALLTALLGGEAARGAAAVTWLAPPRCVLPQALGFTHWGRYVCYQKRLNG